MKTLFKTLFVLVNIIVVCNFTSCKKNEDVEEFPVDVIVDDNTNTEKLEKKVYDPLFNFEYTDSTYIKCYITCNDPDLRFMIMKINKDYTYQDVVDDINMYFNEDGYDYYKITHDYSYNRPKDSIYCLNTNYKDTNKIYIVFGLEKVFNTYKITTDIYPVLGTYILEQE